MSIEMHQKKTQDEAEVAKFCYISKILGDMKGFNPHTYVWPPSFDPSFLYAAWYGSPLYFNHPHVVQAAAFTAAAAAAAAAVAATSDCYEPPSCKRRKTGNSFSDAMGEQDEVTRVYSRRGPVTFRPYSDVESGMRRGYRKNTHGTGGDWDGRTPGAKRKVGSTREAKARVGSGREKAAQANVADDEDNGRTTIGNLFPEILEMIFGNLDIRSKGRAARVCVRWRDAANCKSVWKGIEARLHLGRPNSYLYPSLVRRGIKKVQVLSLRKSLREIVTSISNLEVLNLSGCYNLTDSALEFAFNREVPSIKELNLSLCKDVSDNSLGKIATNCKNLCSLDLGGCAKVTNTGLLLISWGLKKLAYLNLRSCRQISDHGIGHLSGLDADGKYTSAPSALGFLGLQDCQKLTDESLKHISVGMPQLRHINLSFCVSVTDTGLKSLAKLPLLQSLNLRSCDNVSDIGVGFLSEDSPAATTIQFLDVSFCSNVSDAGLGHIASGLPSLRSLLLTTCTVTDQGLERLASGKSAASIQTLNLGQCVNLTDTGVNAVADKMRALTTLDLYGCPKVTSDALNGVRLKMPHLKKLNLEL